MPSLVTITIDPRIAEVRPALVDLLAPILSYDEVEFSAMRGRLSHQHALKRVYDHLSGDRLICPVGCVRRIQHELLRLGHQVRVVDLRRGEGHKLSVDGAYANKAESEFSGLAAAVDGDPLGTILAVPSIRPQIVGTIARLYPGARIFVACSTRREAEYIAAELGSYVGGKVEAVHGWNWRSPCRVVCGTFASLDRSAPSDWPILIFADAYQALGRATHEVRSSFGNSRIYALADPARPRSPKDDLLLEVLAGPVIYKAPGSRRCPPPIDVVFVTYAAPQAPPHKDPQQKRRQLWDHEHRNEAIATVARAVYDADHGTLASHGLLLDGYGDSATLPASPSTIIVVESPEHARRLGKLLAGWHVPCGSAAADSATAAWGLPPRSIVTMVQAEKFRHITADVVILAAGGNWPQIPSAFAKRRGRLLLIDLADEFNNSALQDTRDRFNTYKKIGCNVHDAAWLATTPAEITRPGRRDPLRRTKRRKRNTSRRPGRRRT